MTEEAAEAPLLLDVSSSPRSGSGRRSKPWSRSSRIGRSGSISGGSSVVEYTSLRDVLGEDGGGSGAGDAAWSEATPRSWRAGGSWGEPCACCHAAAASLQDDDDIRSRLLRRAASAYMQSAAAIAAAGGGGGGGEDDDGPAGCCCCLARLWRGGGRTRRGRVLARAACSPWQGCVDDPAAVVARAARRVAAFVAGRVAGVWAWL